MFLSINNNQETSENNQPDMDSHQLTSSLVLEHYVFLNEYQVLVLLHTSIGHWQKTSGLKGNNSVTHHDAVLHHNYWMLPCMTCFMSCVNLA